MTRRELSLESPPEDTRGLQDFPRTRLGPETVLYRVTSKHRDPWWFNSSGSGRFDLEEPEGTCYLATEALAAILEVIGSDREGGLISTEVLATRKIHQLRIPYEHSLADLTARRAAKFGVTLEIHILPRYQLTQSWAHALAQSGAQGLLYLARHDPAAGHSVALFGPGGERDWAVVETDRLDEEVWTERLWQACRIRVAPRPYRNELSIVE